MSFDNERLRRGQWKTESSNGIQDTLAERTKAFNKRKTTRATNATDGEGTSEKLAAERRREYGRQQRVRYKISIKGISR